jgi:hypothetical protein
MFADEPAWDDDDAPLAEGDIVAAPMPQGQKVTLRFVAPFEPWLTLGQARVTDDASEAHRALLLWLGRRQAALWRALDLERGLRGTLTAGQLVVTDVVGLHDGEALDHGSMMSVLEPAKVRWPAFTSWGASTGSHTDLVARARSLFAVGTQLDVRVEEGKRVLSRRRLRVGRS